jgi:hypothetical protein
MSILEPCKLYLRARPVPTIVAVCLGIATSVFGGSKEIAPSVQLLLSMASLVALLFVGYTALVDIYRYLAPRDRKAVEGNSAMWSYALRSLAIGICWTVPYFAFFTVFSRLGLSPTLNLILLQIPSVFLGSLVWSVFGVWVVAAIAEGPERQQLFQRSKGPIAPTFGMLAIVNGLFSVVHVLSNVAASPNSVVSVGFAVVFATLSVLREIVVAQILINAYLRDHSNLASGTPAAEASV